MTETRNSGFATDVVKLISGSTLAQVITILAAPILSRLYEPAAFGLLGLFLATTRILTRISSLRYELAIMLPKEEEEAINVVGLASVIVLLFSLLLFPVVILLGPSLATILHAQDLIPYLYLIPIGVFLGGTASVLNYWHSRQRNFGKLSITRLIQSTTSVSVQLGVGITEPPSGSGLIAGFIAGQGVSVLTLISIGWQTILTYARQWLSFKKMLAALKRYKKFPRYNVPATLMNTISWQLPTFFLSYFFTPTEVGFFALGNRVIELPMRLIGGSISQVFFQRASVAHRQGSLNQVVASTFRYLVTLSFFPLMLLVFIAPEMFSLIFGNEWHEAGVYTQLLAPWTFFWFISSPMSTVFSVLEKQEWGFWINASILFSRFLALGMGGLLGSARLMMVFFAISGVLLYGLISILVMKLANVPLRFAFEVLWEKGWTILPAGGILLILKYLALPNIIILLVTILLTILYYIYQLHTEPYLQKLVKNFIENRLQRLSSFIN